jgi:hypothetical protein
MATPVWLHPMRGLGRMATLPHIPGVAETVVMAGAGGALDAMKGLCGLFAGTSMALALSCPGSPRGCAAARLYSARRNRRDRHRELCLNTAPPN